ncbi:3-oxoacyl-ACP synthase III family protein [Plantactinospora sp. KBS50]|uniref:3-oxoacyl-ACP synthase III family protein n=1 Tax=Plantactinospora sp. KBS50 TaxID=2024580 RepID=UPI000BAAB1B1|nr:3-oxoacyl-[acyl-carrier-protein] synthase III C-terminal domain-containing protein [Plantactinospora sp. KBS50]ASW54771.1 3-oxoacyl-ACP synthase [Plantactinospora sp. KBS50]
MAGIVDFEIRLPDGRARTAEMSRRSGLAEPDILKITHCAEWPALGPGEYAWSLATEAARALLDRTGIGPAAIDRVVYAGSGEWDVPFWSPAAKVAAELGVTGAHCFEVTNFCNASALAYRVGMREIDAGAARHVLVLLGDRLSQLVDYADPDSRHLFNFGDAPAAVLLGADGERFGYRHGELLTDPSWSDYYQGELDDFQVLMRRRGRRPGLSDAYLTNYLAVLSATLERLGVGLGDVRFLLVNHSDRNVHQRLLDALALPAERSVFNYHRYGHMGGADTLLALDDLLAADRLAKGDLVLLASSGMGFSWGVTALEFRG